MSLDIARLDTICALSSASGKAALAIVRASGPQAFQILTQIFTRTNQADIKPFVAMHGFIRNKNDELIDDVVSIYFPSQKSFTGESSFEIHCHGNQLIVDEILQVICTLGARLAEPGEFSLRAMLNGKIDLAQAESIADLIHAQSKDAQKIALKGVLGGLRDKTQNVRENLVSVISEIEARMDFPDEDLGGYDRKYLLLKLHEMSFSLNELLKNARYSLRLHEGARVVICGLPNAGKSTLLNSLLKDERAIVHETAGTTRDVIEAMWELKGVPITLVDVAGIRDLNESCAVEKIGIERAVRELKRAHLVIWLADATVSEPFSDATIRNYLCELDVPIVHVLNKIELVSPREDLKSSLFISAKTGQGLSDLIGALENYLVGKIAKGADLFITRARQRDELQFALVNIEDASVALSQGMGDEVVTSLLRSAGIAFDRLFGTELNEDVLDTIFSQFCIGK